MTDDGSKQGTTLRSWLLPIATGIIGILAGLATAIVTRLNSNDLLAKEYVGIAVDILKLPAESASENSEEFKTKTDEEKKMILHSMQMRSELRYWAVNVINSYAKVKMSSELVRYLASENGKKLLLQIVDDSKTDTGVLVCNSASADPDTQRFAVALKNGIVASGQFGSSYVSDWKDEGSLTSSSMKGTISIIKDNGHAEEGSIPSLREVIQKEQRRFGINLPIVTRSNPSPVKSEWYLSVVVCP